ncbi:thioesterase family protein [Chelatococcus reniformis]|uniref:Thioesterase n=1 Tax=Chelatococcus reniformis TaxID=1494448 RepID=A0A916XDX1_9HYPH|nr:thioesterase family protein [Chelatococcus reniformis]GGC64717.1 thioesterase [Chelatococcus reniformis]
MADHQFDSGRSGVNAWECDENDHLNVRFYLARLAEAQGFVVHGLGIEDGRTLRPSRHHVRFRRELRAGDMASMRSRLVELREDSAVVHHALSCAGEVAASFLSVDRHVDETTGDPVAWSGAQRERLERLVGVLPEGEGPRSITLDDRSPEIDLARAEALDLVEIFRGRVAPGHCDASGRMAIEWVMGRFSDGVGNLWDSLGHDHARMLARGRGSVVLETCVRYGALPPADTLLVGRSALVGIMGRTLRFAHLLFDARTGARIADAAAVAAVLDHETRRTVAFTDEEQADLHRHVKQLS